MDASEYPRTRTESGRDAVAVARESGGGTTSYGAGCGTACDCNKVTGEAASEVLPLEWRQVDRKAGEVRLDPGTTKNNEGRTFFLTDD